MMSQRSKFKLTRAEETLGSLDIISHSRGRTNRHKGVICQVLLPPVAQSRLTGGLTGGLIGSRMTVKIFVLSVRHYIKP